VLDRAAGNGLINSDNPPHDNIVLDLWDYVTLEEYTAAANKIKGKTPYHARLDQLSLTIATAVLDERMPPEAAPIRIIETHVVNTVGEALAHCARWMEMGLEGAIYKDRDAIFRDGTSPQQLKLKLEIDADVRITGFKPGTVGTKREGKIGSIEYATDDGQVRGYASGFTDAELDDMDGRREEIMGQIMTLTCSDITRGRNNDHYALSHPRFVELRSDKTETDTLERILEAKKMAMCVDDNINQEKL
jgi:DNA ligase 1